jgi:hypothetical protein
MNGKYLESIESEVVMGQKGLGSFGIERNRKFRWQAVLPKRRAWIQTLVLFPFGLPVANFLGGGWNFAVNLMLEEHQYLVGILSIAFNLLLPVLFFAFLFHWCWFAWKHEGQAWYPGAEGFWAGLYATATIAISFGMVRLFTQNLGVCGSPGWGEIGQSLLCNLDNYGFESKSWFGVWFILAAYCYQVQGRINNGLNRIFRRQSPQIGFAVDNDLAPADRESIPPSGEG